jgi:hypothetical protein
MPADLWLISPQNFDEETNAHFIIAHEVEHAKSRSVGQSAKE